MNALAVESTRVGSALASFRLSDPRTCAGRAAGRACHRRAGGGHLQYWLALPRKAPETQPEVAIEEATEEAPTAAAEADTAAGVQEGWQLQARCKTGFRDL